ncbi:MAG: ribonuclease III [bacterium]|nr:ribonuclease III [bacterium]
MSDDEDRDLRLAELEEALGHRFADPSLFATALRHASYAHERATASGEGDDPEGESNERLEFLGDAVLALVVAEALYAAKPDWQEGELTRALHAIVEGRSLATLAEELGVGSVMRLGRTEESSGGGSKPKVLEDAMEALIGALYLDGGIDPVRRFVGARFADALAADATPVERDPKTELQERLMRDVGEFPSYRLTGDTGIEGDDVRFSVEVVSKGEVLGRGTDRTKRRAEKAAAREALARTACVGEAD